jgi:hypothetical protein
MLEYIDTSFILFVSMLAEGGRLLRMMKAGLLTGTIALAEGDIRRETVAAEPFSRH